ncbi:MAG: hypothetical protein IIA91_07725 [Chloroflexi bacterium]|nr:hypothetical protein [Chloroflexota bacterium]
MMIGLYRWLALLIMVLIFAQAALAGRFLFVDHDAVDIHQAVANGLSVLVIVHVALALITRTKWSRRVPVLTALLAILVIIQTGLGYAGRESADVLAIHVPVGVLTFGVASLLTAIAFSEESTIQHTEK